MCPPLPERVCGTNLIVPLGTCSTCVTASCCDAMKACEADPACVECNRGGGTDCGKNTKLQAVAACFNGPCASSCPPFGAPACAGDSIGSPDAVCNECLGASCCDALTLCTAQYACQVCLSGEVVEGCQDVERFAAVETCLRSSCGTACTGPAVCDSGFTPGATIDACESCLTAKCCDAAKACKADATCEACAAGPIGVPGTDCSGNAAFDAWTVCHDETCKAECK
jgi:hypothetical protein